MRWFLVDSYIDLSCLDEFTHVGLVTLDLNLLGLGDDVDIRTAGGVRPRVGLVPLVLDAVLEDADGEQVPLGDGHAWRGPRHFALTRQGRSNKPNRQFGL